MQAIGGTKGSQLINFDLIAENSQEFVTLTISPYIPSAFTADLNSTLPGLNPLPFGLNNLAGLHNYGVNLRDNIAEGGDIPLQFVFEPSDCRIFYTSDSVRDPLALWEQAWDAAWGGSTCAYGSLSTGRGSNGGNGTGFVPVSKARMLNAPVAATLVAAALGFALLI